MPLESFNFNLAFNMNQHFSIFKMNNIEAKEKSFTVEEKVARKDSEMDLHEDNITIVEENKVKI